LIEHARNPDGTNYASEIRKAGSESSVYTKRQDGGMEIATAISGIITFDHKCSNHNRIRFLIGPAIGCTHTSGHHMIFESAPE
jgi:hypothetical protein